MTREQLVEKIEKTKAEARTAGVIHRKDLQRSIRHMEKELRDFDRFRARAQKPQSVA